MITWAYTDITGTRFTMRVNKNGKVVKVRKLAGKGVICPLSSGL